MIESVQIIIDWKTIDVETLPAHIVMDYFEWSNRSSCKLVQYFGGSMARRPANSSLSSGDSASADISPVTGYDGHYAVCLDPIAVAPSPDQNCVVYSFGIKNEWSYDDAFDKFGCQVHSFDPAMTNGTVDFDRSPRIHFHNLALNDADEGTQNRTLQTIYEKLGHGKDGGILIHHLKIDIEGDEWRIIPEIVRSGMLVRIKQLALEIHLKVDNQDLDYYRRMVGVIKSLEDHGMIRFDSYYNHWSAARFPALGNRSAYFAHIMAWYNSNFSHPGPNFHVIPFNR